MKRRVVISNSMLRTLNICHTKAWLQSNGWSAGGAEENKRMRAGRDAHLAFEAWMKGAPVDDCVEAFRGAYQEYSDKFVLDSDAYHVDNLSRILSVFFSSNPLVAQPFEVVAVEEQIEYVVHEIDDTEYVVSDKSDGKVRWKDTGDLLSLEVKTTGSWDLQEFIGEFANDSQVTTHVAACRAKGQDVKGVLLLAIRFNKLPNPFAVTKTGKPASCNQAGHGKVKDCWTSHVHWELAPLTRTEEDISIWLENTRAKMWTYDAILVNALKDTAQNGIYGHCGRCDYLAFCKSYRRNFDLLTKREREPGILYSGVYENDA